MPKTLQRNWEGDHQHRGAPCRRRDDEILE